MKLFKLVILIAILALFLFGCSNKTLTGPTTSDRSVTGGVVKPAAVVYPITAGQTIPVGTMTVWNDAVNLYIKYDTTGGWLLEQCHAQIGATYADISDSQGDALPPGSMDYQQVFTSPYVTTWTFTIPMALYNLSIGQTIYWVAHCSVLLPDGNGGYDQQTGFGGNQTGQGHRWWFWDTYTIDNPPTPPGDYQYETAMMRMYDVVNDYTYRWRMGNGKFHPWFGFVKTYPVETPQTYFFYAGKSHKCGEVQIWKEGDNLKVSVGMMNGWLIDELHLKVQLVDYIGPPAFGLFPYPMSFDPAVGAYVYTIPWDAAWDGMELDIALHGAVKLPLTARN
jgi:hypothetical protein